MPGLAGLAAPFWRRTPAAPRAGPRHRAGRGRAGGRSTGSPRGGVPRLRGSSPPTWRSRSPGCASTEGSPARRRCCRPRPISCRLRSRSPVPARDRPRRGRLRPHRARSGAHAERRRRPVAPRPHGRATISADEAESRLSRWHAAASATGGPVIAPTAEPYDVAVIGAGVVGSRDRAAALAPSSCRSRCSKPRPMWARDEQGQHGDPAHRLRRDAGFAGSRGWWPAATSCWRAYADEVGIPVEAPARSSWRGTTSRRASSRSLEEKAARNGYRALRIVDRAERLRHRAAPRSGRAGGLLVPGERIICPWSTAARVRDGGGDERRRAPAHSVDARRREARRRRRITPRGRASAPRWVVNAAGLTSRRRATASSGTHASPSGRAAASSSSSTSSRGRWCRTILCRCRPRRPRACSSRRRSSATSCSGRPPRTSTTRRTRRRRDGLDALLAKGRADPAARSFDEEVTAVYAGLRAAPSTATTRSIRP